MATQPAGTGESGAPRILVLPDEERAAAAAAEHVLCRLAARPRLVLGLATGATMVPLYACLVAAHRQGRASFLAASSFNLDEYVGLPGDHPGSYRATMRRLLFDHVDMDPARARLPDGTASDPDAEAARYEAGISAEGGIDLQLLGLGGNGHIGFNEPPADFASRTHVAMLAATTRAANRPLFPPGEAVPARAITMGIRTILDAREILLVATGQAKAEAVRRALTGPVTPDCPASVVQTHGNTTVVLDAAAAALLPRHAGRPDLA